MSKYELWASALSTSKATEAQRAIEQYRAANPHTKG